ncbi:MAG: alpha/beta hydrolase, partial [Pseudomonadota bacterium]
FTDGTIGKWAEDAQHVIEQLTKGPQIIVGSSMGGWVSCLLIRAIPQRIAGFVGIAAAPDFTEDSMWAQFSDDQKAQLERKGIVHLPSDYGDPYPITKAFIEDGRDQLVLRTPLKADFPVRLLQGSDDTDVLPSVAQRLFEHMEGDDIRLTLVKGSDHRFSNATELGLIRKAIHSVTEGIRLTKGALK